MSRLSRCYRPSCCSVSVPLALGFCAACVLASPRERFPFNNLPVCSSSRALSATVHLLSRIANSRSRTIVCTFAWISSALNLDQFGQGKSTRLVFCQSSKPARTCISKHPRDEQSARIIVRIEVGASDDLLLCVTQINAVCGHGHGTPDWRESPS